MADSVEQVVYEYLTADAVFLSELSGVYWLDVEHESPVYPYVVFWAIDDAGTQTYISNADQGEQRIQFDLWDDSKIRGARLRTALRVKIKNLNETRGGYRVYTLGGVSETTVQREAATDPFHFVVDAVIVWNTGD